MSFFSFRRHSHQTLALSVLISACVLISGCATKPQLGADVGPRLETKAYENLIKKNTRHDLQYEGFYNKFELHATFINSEVQTAILQKKSDVLRWNAQEAQKEREKLFQESTTQTKFFLSFFVPSVRLNDLHKGSSIWKIYLESNGQRYEGKASRRNGKLEDIQALFPHHNRWSVAYDVVFNVPLSGIEAGPVTFIVTSTQGTSKLNF